MNSRVIMTHPFKHQFGPIPAHSKPANNFNKYPPQFRPNGPPKKKPTFFRGPPSFPPNKKYPYYGMPHGIVSSGYNKPKPNRPPPQQGYRPYYSNDETPKETIATFVNRPVTNPQQGPYNGYTKNPWVSYGPPYPPKPFKSYGVYGGNDEEVIQGSQQVSATIKYPGHQKPRRPNGQKRPIKFNNNPSGPSDYSSGPEELNYNPSAPGLFNPSAQGSIPSVQGYNPNLQGSSHVNFDPNTQDDDQHSTQVSASVRYPGYQAPVNTPTLNYPEAVGTLVNYPSPSTSGKRRRPQRQEESAVQLT